MEFTVLIENTKKESKFTEEHGLSIMVNHLDKTYLIDVGYSDGYIKNAKLLNIDLNAVKDIIITHGHADHGGGLEFINRLNKPTVHLKSSALETYYSNRDVGLVDIGLLKYKDTSINFNKVKCPQTISEGVHILSVGIPKKPQPISNGLLLDSSKKLDQFDHELFIVFEENQDLYVFTGCAHKGFLNIIDETERHFPNKKIKAMIGGLHLVNKCHDNDTYGKYLDKIDVYFKDYKDLEIFTGHCTGQAAIDYLKEKNYKVTQLYTGLTHKF